jgi:hypothetical protein
VGEEASVSKARCHPEQGCVNVAGIWDEGHASYPGRSAYLSVKGLILWEDRVMVRQKSAEGKVDRRSGRTVGTSEPGTVPRSR